MLRYNIFNLIHKSLRTMLYDTALTLQQTDFTNPEETSATLQKMNAVIEAFEQHGFHEDETLMPVIEKFKPVTIASFEKDHVDDRRMGNDLRHLQNIYEHSTSAEERIFTGSAITKSFGAYMIFNLQHMQREEIELNELLWENYTDEQILKVNEQIIAGIPPEEIAITTKWFLQSINSCEAKEFLIGLKMGAPEQVFTALFNLTETYLPERFRTEVQEAVLAYKVVSPVF
ncbi:MAG: hemerythrin domain-containing protein [Ferruginibacter sp.]